MQVVMKVMQWQHFGNRNAESLYLCRFPAFVLSNGSSLALFVGGIRVAKALMEKYRQNGKEKVIYASWKHSNTENYKFSWIKKYGMYRNQNRSVSENSGDLWRVIAEKEGKAYNAKI